MCAAAAVQTQRRSPAIRPRRREHCPVPPRAAAGVLNQAAHQQLLNAAPRPRRRDRAGAAVRRRRHGPARAGQDAKARAAPPPPTPLDDELIQWDATPQENDEYASNPASDLAGFVHALSGDDHHDRRSCGLATMLGSEAETAPPDEPPPPSWEDGPRARRVAAAPRRTRSLSAARLPCRPRARRAGRLPRVPRASDAALDAAFLEFDLAAAAPPSARAAAPRARAHARGDRRCHRGRCRRGRSRRRRRPSQATAASAGAGARAARPSRRGRCRVAAAYAGGFHPGAQGEAAAARARRGVDRAGAATGAGHRRRGARPAVRGPPRRCARPGRRPATAPPRPPPPAAPPASAPARDSLDAAPSASTSPPRRRAPPRPRPPVPARRCREARPPRRRPRPQPPRPPRPATGPRTSLDAALLGFDLDGAVAEAGAAVQTKRCRIVECTRPRRRPDQRRRHDQTPAADGRLGARGVAGGARGHLVPWAAVGEPCVTPRASDDSIDQASPWASGWRVRKVFVASDGGASRATVAREAWLTCAGGSGGGASKPAASGAPRLLRAHRAGERDASGIVRNDSDFSQRRASYLRGWS